MKREITFNSDIDSFSLKESNIIENWILNVAKLEGFEIGELNFIFVSDKEILEMNNKFLNHNYYTDVITFDYSKDNIIGGDVFISIDTVKDNARVYCQRYEVELRRVIIHGVLHLCGYEDGLDQEKVEMKGKEDFYLKLMYNEI